MENGDIRDPAFLLPCSSQSKKRKLTDTVREEMCWKSMRKFPHALKAWVTVCPGASWNCRQTLTIELDWRGPSTCHHQPGHHSLYGCCWTPLTLLSLRTGDSFPPLALRTDSWQSSFLCIFTCCFKVLGGTNWADGPRLCLMSYLQGWLGRQTSHFWTLPPNTILQMEKIPQTWKRISSSE